MCWITDRTKAELWLCLLAFLIKIDCNLQYFPGVRFPFEDVRIGDLLLMVHAARNCLPLPYQHVSLASPSFYVNMYIYLNRAHSKLESSGLNENGMRFLPEVNAE